MPSALQIDEITDRLGTGPVTFPQGIVDADKVIVHAVQNYATSYALVFDATFVYPTEIFDSHTAYDTTTGVFTAPVAGTYHAIAVHNMVDETLFSYDTQFHVNNVALSGDRGVTTHATQVVNRWCTGTSQAMFTMAAGDTFKVVNRYGSWGSGTFTVSGVRLSLSIVRVA